MAQLPSCFIHWGSALDRLSDHVCAHPTGISLRVLHAAAFWYAARLAIQSGPCRQHTLHRKGYVVADDVGTASHKADRIADSPWPCRNTTSAARPQVHSRDLVPSNLSSDAAGSGGRAKDLATNQSRPIYARQSRQSRRRLSLPDQAEPSRFGALDGLPNGHAVRAASARPLCCPVRALMRSGDAFCLPRLDRVHKRRLADFP